MYLLDASEIITALPAIILGMICMGFVYFIIFGLISKATGKSIRTQGGLTHKGQTVATPDMLDNTVSDIRKVFDKKYKIKKKIQEEINNELRERLAPIESLTSGIFWIQSQYRASGKYTINGLGFSNQRDSTILQLIEVSLPTSIYEEVSLSKADMKKLEELNINLLISKKEIENQVKAKYEQKLSELIKYL